MWHRSSSRLLGYPTLRHQITNESTLVGKHGEVYAYSQDTYSFIVWHHTVANKLAKLTGRASSYKKGEEALFRFSTKEARTMLQLLKPTRRSVLAKRYLDTHF